YYVEWHMRRALAPLLFDDEHPQEGEARRASVVAPAQRSSGALEKALTKRTKEGLTVHSFQSLLRDLATVTKNRVRPRALAAAPFEVIATPTALQRRAFELLGVDYRM
ncbi:MAG: IS1634 family transposase, partial [Planctomycetes bacterium]|nr:IS1634 family transposase [Planctomycetota bacterium]